ncbi:MAG: hypothetical protein GC159_08660 [Phycisphaera sp.]|nr:hypothetical protein [Phycisphaera sp.]
MAKFSKRTTLRWIHIIFALPILAYIYGPQDQVQQYVSYFRYIYVPVVALSGLLMWKGHALKRLGSKKAAD